jgi:hypothetical protein
MSDQSDQSKMTETAVKQNLLLWELAQSFLDLDKELDKINNA